MKNVGQKFGFGIEGEWLSEYVPSPSAQFYFIQDGIKVSCSYVNPYHTILTFNNPETDAF